MRGMMDVLTYLSRIRANADLVEKILVAEPVDLSGPYAQLITLRISEDSGNLRALLGRMQSDAAMEV